MKRHEHSLRTAAEHPQENRHVVVCSCGWTVVRDRLADAATVFERHQAHPRLDVRSWPDWQAA